ncbi:MAG: tRNA (guanosine(46)-N7)-methyltransferase TrmB [Bacteroidales bacterium]|jgi:tRNA (guanine-N7-)-methyltransferase|nr:tRNA (guanosine(46)-N7)-methyltransferase TrmB [Bacteroidales bacterium]
MGHKHKLQRFAENKTFSNVIQPEFSEVFRCDYKLKNKWKAEFWHNDNPIVLELGCGKGEYTVELAQKYSEKNFIGVDIKGARFWRGAKTAIEQRIPNVAFIRSRIEFLNSFFATHEISEIWITFPDPQIEKRRTKKRLTSPRFLNMYKTMLAPGARIHLKTDSQELHAYTKQVLQYNNQPILRATTDVYHSELLDDTLAIKTFYEKQYLERGKTITYIEFSLTGQEIVDLPEEDDTITN